MPKNRAKRVHCPACGAALEMDLEYGALHPVSGETAGRDLDLGQAANLLRDQQQAREQRFEQARADQRQAGEKLARKFEEGLRRAKDDHSPPPLRDLDLD